ncbi:Transposon TX1 uncharacterized 82 kDa protein [Labeo rohita]|uniref:Transposon TX1 uncharacterized 82 kDa protein n=1 Tax=Labeo rohita TaxID=84645 RepID=A0ABQ8N1R0_LABRO|nr:Transposon TX1 uncharacterized 82 kDa protein [Labeo rohita]
MGHLACLCPNRVEKLNEATLPVEEISANAGENREAIVPVTDGEVPGPSSVQTAVALVGEIAEVEPADRSNEEEEMIVNPRALLCYGKFASPIKTIPLGCKNTTLKHVMSFRRQVAMFLKQPDLDVSFRISFEGKTYMIYANWGHKRSTCPHKAGSSDVNTTSNSTDDSEACESNGEKTTLNENSTVDSVANESNGGQTTPLVNSVDSVASESTVRQITPKVNSTVVLEVRTESNEGQSILNETKQSDSCCEVVQMNEVVNVEINKMMSCTEMVREEGIRDDDMLSDISETGSQSMEDMYSLDEINDFLDTSFGKVVEVKDFFPDVEKFFCFSEGTAAYSEL